jgi:hypothetical protein
VGLSALQGVSVPVHVTVPPVHVHPGCVEQVVAVRLAHGVTVPTQAAVVCGVQPALLHDVESGSAAHGVSVPVQVVPQVHP